MATMTKDFHIANHNTTVEVTAYFDRIYYGGDADGNRGEYRDALQKTDYKIPDTNDDGKYLSASEKLEIELELRNLLADVQFWEE